MSDGPNPIVQRRRLRSELRSARNRAGLTQGQVATAMDWSLSKVIRIENGSVGISKNDVEALLRLYHIDDKNQVDELVSLAKEARERSWWGKYRGIVSEGFLKYIEYEESASVIRSFQPLLVPGLLQTPEYARAVIGQLAGTAVPSKTEDLVEVRLTRQEVLDRAEPPMLWHVVDEGVVRHLVGGPSVMRHQILHIIDVAARPNVSFQIIPFGIRQSYMFTIKVKSALLQMLKLQRQSGNSGIF